MGLIDLRVENLRVFETLWKPTLQCVFWSDERRQFCSQHYGMIVVVISSSRWVWVTW